MEKSIRQDLEKIIKTPIKELARILEISEESAKLIWVLISEFLKDK